MDLTTVTLNSATALIQYVLGPVTLILMLSGLVIYWRSGTTHTLLLKLWSVFAGQANIKSSSVSKFASDEQDLAHFRFMTRVKVTTLREAERLIAWAEQHNVSIHLIRASGQYFDLEKPTPREKLFAVKETKLILPFLCFVMLTGIMALGLILATQNRAFIRMQDTGNYFTIDAHYIYPIFSDEKLAWDDCERKDIVPSIKGHDREQFCAAKLDKSLAQTISENVDTQKPVGWLLSAEALVALLAVAASAKTIVSAGVLRKKLRSQGISAYYQAQLSTT